MLPAKAQRRYQKRARWESGEDSRPSRERTWRPRAGRKPGGPGKSKGAGAQRVGGSGGRSERGAGGRWADHARLCSPPERSPGHRRTLGHRDMICLTFNRRWRLRCEDAGRGGRPPSLGRAELLEHRPGPDALQTTKPATGSAPPPR